MASLTVPRAAAEFVPLDPTFGAGGIVAGTLGALRIRSAPVVLPGGDLVLAGTADGRLAVGRFRPDGQPDAAFGIRTLPVVSSTPIRPIVDVQPDGRVLVATTFTVGNGGFGTGDIDRRWFLTRLTTTGEPDASFSADGSVVVTFPGKRADLAAVLVAADGRILLVGSGLETNTLLAARLLSNGQLDRSFGIEGKLQVPLPGQFAGLSAGALDAEGRVVVTGSAVRDDSAFDLLVARLRPDGTLDSDFGFNGSAVVDGGRGSDFGSHLVVQPDGGVLVAGRADAGPEAEQPVLMRLDASGQLDPGFGEGGMVRLVTGKPAGRYFADGLALLADGRITVAGNYRLVDSEQKGDPLYRVPQPFVAVLHPDGTPDATFDGHDGIAFLPIALASGDVQIAPQPEGRLLVFVRDSVLRLNSTTVFGDLKLTIGADKTVADPGPLTFFVTVTNQGSHVDGGLVTLRASKSVSVVSATAGKADVAVNRLDVTWKVFAIAPGASAVLTLRTSANGFEEGIGLSGSVKGGTELDTVDNAASILVSTSRFATI